MTACKLPATLPVITLVTLILKHWLALCSHIDLDTDSYVECEYTDADIQACDVSAWQDMCVPTKDGTLLYERWFQSKLGPVHVGAWEGTDGRVSLTLSTVRDGGYDMWEPSSKTVADTGKSDTWGELDRAYGSRAAWESDLATVADMIRKS